MNSQYSYFLLAAILLVLITFLLFEISSWKNLKAWQRLLDEIQKERQITTDQTRLTSLQLVEYDILSKILTNHRSYGLPRLTTKNNEELNQPPKFAQYLLYFLPKKDREPLVGDLEEEYRGIYEKFGRRKASVWYYCQVAMSFWPYLASVVKKLAGWGVVGWVGNALRRLIG